MRREGRIGEGSGGNASVVYMKGKYGSGGKWRTE